MTCPRAKALHHKVNSLLITLDLDTPLDGILLTTDTLCVIRYIPHEAWWKNLEKQLLTRHEREDEVAGREAALPLGGSGTAACSGSVVPLPLVKTPADGLGTTALDSPAPYRHSSTTAH